MSDFVPKWNSLNFLRADTGETWEIPAYHALECQIRERPDSPLSHRHVVDPTGCGNAFCGGFAIGWWKTRNLLTAGLYGTISASISKYIFKIYRMYLKIWIAIVLPN